MTPEDRREHLVFNFANSWKMASNWVMWASGVVFAFYLTLPVDKQQEIIAHLPVQPWLLPIITSAIGYAARLWPQKSLPQADLPATKEDPQS